MIRIGNLPHYRWRWLGQISLIMKIDIAANTIHLRNHNKTFHMCRVLVAHLIK